MVPKGWRSVCLEDIASKDYGMVDGPFGSNLPASLYVPDGIPIIRGGNLSLGEERFNDDKFVFVSEITYKQLERSSCRPGDIVFTKKGTLGQTGIVPNNIGYDKFLISSNQMKLTVALDVADPLYVYYFVSSPESRDRIIRESTASGVPKTNLTYLRRFPIVMPPLYEQQAIARILGALDDKIELNRRMNHTLEEMARALFKSWFVDFDPVTAKAEGRVPFGMNAETASLFPAEFKDTGEGAIPKGWSISKIGDIANVIDCLHAKKPERQESGKIFLQLNNIRDDSLIDLSDNFYISDEDYTKWISRLETREGDCVITNVGRVGAVAQIPPGLSAALGRNMTAIRCKEDFQFPAFLITCLTSDVMREEINTKIDTGTILDALNVKNIPLLKFILAPMPVLSAFEKIVRPLRKKMEINLNNSQTLATIRDALLPKLLSGELRVKQAEKIIETM